jgi:hypothetical protein
MDTQGILSRLERNEGRFPSAAVQEAIAHRDEIIPPLLEVLAAAARDPQAFATDQDRMIHIYAMFLLAQFREKRAYPLLVQIFSTPGDTAFDLAADVVTENLGSILASVSDGDTGGMIALVENERANEYVRSAALKGLLTLVAQGTRNRDDVMTYFRGLFHKLERTPGNVWNGLASACADLCPHEVVEELRLAYEDELIEPFYIRWKEIVHALEAGREAAMKALKERHSLINDVEKEMGWWACFPENEKRWNRYESLSTPPPTITTNEAPLRKAQIKVGRNEPCPCGSGKKFKKCCGR